MVSTHVAGQEIELWTLLKNDKGGTTGDLYVFRIFIGNVYGSTQNVIRLTTKNF